MIREAIDNTNVPMPLLITGVAGVSGYNAFHYFSSRYPGQVIATRQVNNWPLKGPGIVACDAEDPVRLAELFDQYQFKSVINCAGSCRLKSCELDPTMAQRLNVQGVSSLLDQVEKANARLLHLSIDLVYSGDGDGDYVESDIPDPVTIYGKTMVEAEQIIQSRYSAACMLRISLPMGISFNGHAGAIDWIQARFQKSKPATLYYDEVRTPTYTDCLNLLLEQVLASDLSGLYHAGGPRKLSLYQIAQIVNRVGGYAPEHLMGCLRHEAGPMPPRAGNVSLNSSKLTEALGYAPFTPWPLNDAHVPTHDEWHLERGGDDGSPELLKATLYRNPDRSG